MWNRCKVDRPHLLIHLRKELQELGEIEAHRLTSQNLRLTASKSSELEETGSKLRKIGKLKSMVLPQPGTSVNHIAWQRSQRPDLGALRSGSAGGLGTASLPGQRRHGVRSQTASTEITGMAP